MFGNYKKTNIIFTETFTTWCSYNLNFIQFHINRVKPLSIESYSGIWFHFNAKTETSLYYKEFCVPEWLLPFAYSEIVKSISATNTPFSKCFVPSSYIIDIISAFPSFILHILANSTTIIKWYFLLLRIMFYTKIHQKEQCGPCNKIIQSKRYPRKFQPEILQIFISLSWGRKIIPFNRLQRRSLCLYSLLIFLNNPHINFYIFCWNPMWQKIFNGWICFSTGP